MKQCVKKNTRNPSVATCRRDGVEENVKHVRKEEGEPAEAEHGVVDRGGDGVRHAVDVLQA